MPSRVGKIILFLLAISAASLLVASGCGSSLDASGETSGKPVVIDFWQPG